MIAGRTPGNVIEEGRGRGGEALPRSRVTRERTASPNPSTPTVPPTAPPTAPPTTPPPAARRGGNSAEQGGAWDDRKRRHLDGAHDVLVLLAQLAHREAQAQRLVADAAVQRLEHRDGQVQELDRRAGPVALL